ncbi:CRTAC1 family protein [Thiocapsa bogorovii]|uniref:CRTAC1 family protein n=1 Tax=Thiocapsa bogorovii TaxID=521689 RepID=UPI001E59C7EE|nr:CRTAC1 family protein [Thiocapsa bogorovii]UHD15910.1 CRTAC1 family protein [Thiocapsa bogorovii]
MTQSKQSTGTTGEVRIRRAFILSVVIIVVALTVGLILIWLVTPPPDRDAVPDAEIQAPSRAVTSASDRPPSVRFTDITAEAGIDFVHVNGAYGERLMPETLGSGAAFLDYDGDGRQDLLLINSNYWPGHEPEGAETPRSALYRNLGGGRFEDVTEAAGLDLTFYGMGVAVGDYDGDGRPDLYLTGLHRNHLFRNEGGRFVEVTDSAGVGGGEDTWSSSAVFFDHDRDGDLDLFVVNYVQWSRDVDLEIDFRLTGLGRAYGAPLNFVGTDNTLFRNEGDGRFTDVTADAGIRVTDPVSGQPVGKGLGVSVVDYDGDGWLELVVANDTVRNFLYRNLGNGRFEEVGIFEGLAYDRNGKATSAMGIDAARFRDDGDLGVVIGNFANEMSSLYVTTEGRPPFVDEAVLEGLGPASRIPLTFGLVFLDYDLDGRLDLLLANGHLEHEIQKVQQSQTYAQPPSLLWNCGEACPGRFVPVEEAGDLLKPFVGRGLTFADIDGDGDLDVLVTQNGRRPALLRNDQATGHHYLRVKLAGRPPNTDAIGAELALTADGVTRYRQVMPARGYLSQVELPVTFGLGETTEVERLLIRWPDGSEQVVEWPQIDTLLVIGQPRGEAS